MGASLPALSPRPASATPGGPATAPLETASRGRFRPRPTCQWPCGRGVGKGYGAGAESSCDDERGERGTARSLPRRVVGRIIGVGPPPREQGGLSIPDWERLFRGAPPH